MVSGLSIAEKRERAEGRGRPSLPRTIPLLTGPLTGRLLAGKWRVGRLIGRGGMSSVYAATHRNGKQVAVKVLRPELAHSGRARTRLLRESYIANRVAHPGIVSIIDDDVTA